MITWTIDYRFGLYEASLKVNVPCLLNVLFSQKLMLSYSILDLYAYENVRVNLKGIFD